MQVPRAPAELPAACVWEVTQGFCRVTVPPAATYQGPRDRLVKPFTCGGLRRGLCGRGTQPAPQRPSPPSRADISRPDADILGPSQVLFCYEQFDELTLLHLREFDKKKLISVETDIVVDHYKEEKLEDGSPGQPPFCLGPGA